MMLDYHKELEVFIVEATEKPEHHTEKDFSDFHRPDKILSPQLLPEHCNNLKNAIKNIIQHT